MANYYASARTSYAKMKDAEAFKKWAAGHDFLEVIEKEDPKHGTLHGLMFVGEYGGIPSNRYDEETDDFIEISIPDEVAPHLAEGWAIILMEAGAEKLRYLGAVAHVVNWKGDNEFIDLNQVAEEAAAQLAPCSTYVRY